MQEKAVKTAKKTLKKNESMKLSQLAKTVVTQLGNDDGSIVVTKEQVKGWITDSSKFTIKGKHVSLSTKRSSSSVSELPSKNEIAVAAANSKKQKTTEPTDAATWRTNHKIVLLSLSATDDSNVALNNDANLEPFQTFAAASGKLNAALIEQCERGNGFTTPSPIQAQAWPILCADKDMVGIAETGSGKTLAFALPALSKLTGKPKNCKSPRMLTLSPTRELAMQSDVVLQEFAAVVNLKSLVVYGGVPKTSQIQALKQGVDCLVATPGRLKDLLQEGTCDLSKVEYLILDEADRMLDMGFEEDVRFIISQCGGSTKRQTAMFSATWPAAIQNIAGEYMNDPVRVYVGFESIVGSNGEGGVDDSLSANKRVTQRVEVIEDRAREGRLRQILNKVHTRKNRVLVFALYKKEAERLEYALKRDGWNVCSIHGNKQQGARTEALESFKNGSCPLMVATDVAARGLDIPNVEVVINYTFPLTIEDYVHRIGRTGRAGKTGDSYTFFQTGDKSHAGELQQVMKQAGQEVPEALMKFGSTIKKKEHKLYGNFGPTGDMNKKATKIVFDSDDE